MVLFFERSRPRAAGIGSLLARLWRLHRDRRDAHIALERLLASHDDHLLRDVGLDRATGHGLIGETLFAPHRGWDRWQG